MPLYNPGLSKINPQELNLIISLSRIMLLQSVILGGGVIINSVLFAKQNFLLPAIGTVLYNVGLIAGLIPGLLLSLHRTPTTLTTAAYLATIGVVLGASLQVGVQVPGVVNWFAPPDVKFISNVAASRLHHRTAVVGALQRAQVTLQELSPPLRPRVPVEGPDRGALPRASAANHHGAACGLTAIARLFRLLELTQRCRERATGRRSARNDIRIRRPLDSFHLWTRIAVTARRVGREQRCGLLQE